MWHPRCSDTFQAPARGTTRVSETFGCESLFSYRAFDHVACSGPGPASSSGAPGRFREGVLQPIFLRPVVRTVGAVVSRAVRLRVLSAFCGSRSGRSRTRQAEQRRGVRRRVLRGHRGRLRRRFSAAASAAGAARDHAAAGRLSIGSTDTLFNPRLHLQIAVHDAAARGRRDDRAAANAA